MPLCSGGRISCMSSTYFTSNYKRIWPWAVAAVVLTITIILLRNQGRLWFCSCGYILLWSGDIWSSDNSQHLFDPYAFTHLLHGVVFFWLLVWLLPTVPLMWRFIIAISIESLWEVFENSAFIIQRYREATLALGYEGDTIVNSLGDIFICGAGFFLAWYLGFRRSLILFVVVELVLVFWIKDSLILSVIMLIYPIEAIKAWQLG